MSAVRERVIDTRIALRIASHRVAVAELSLREPDSDVTRLTAAEDEFDRRAIEHAAAVKDLAEEQQAAGRTA